MSAAVERVKALFRERGTEVASGSNAPLLLEDPTAAWLVTEGKLDVFAVRVVGDRPEGPRDYLFSVQAGELVLGVEPEWAAEVGLLAVGVTGTRTLQGLVSELAAMGRESLLRSLERYALAFSSAMAKRANPRVDRLLEPGDGGAVPADVNLAARKGVVWVRVDSGSLLFDGAETLAVGPADGPFPLAAGAWVRTTAETTIHALREEELDTDALWLGVRTFQRLALEWTALALASDRSLDRERLGRRLGADRASHRRALQALGGVLDPAGGSVDTTGGPLLSACRIAGAPLHLAFQPAPTWERTRGSMSEELRAMCRASGVGYRRVVLGGGWWTRDNGPLLAFVAAAGATDADGEGGTAWSPVALLPTRSGQYEMVDPAAGVRVVVDEGFAAALAAFGFQFYRSLPVKKVTLAALWRFVTFRVWGDVRVLVLMGLLGAGLGLLVPILTGVVFDRVIPSAEGAPLASVFLALAVAAFAGGSFELTRALAVIRLHARVSSDLQMAVLDRLVRLPLPFFRRFTAGDLAARAAGINRIGDALSGATISSLLGSVVSAGAYVLLFVYSPILALVATVLLIVNIAFTVVTARLSVGYARVQQEATGRLSGLVLQLLTGIAKLRVAGSEARAFARWAEEFRRQREMAYQVGRFNNHVQVFNSVLSIGSILAVYWAYTVVAGPDGSGITTGRFLAFNAAFGTFMAAGLAVTSTAIGLLNLAPLWERARPILDEEPEADPARADPGELTGRIEVSHLTFRYREDGPIILDDVSLHAQPGEFIAIIGPSGAGKSTLLRVLLAFDTPQTSSVYYDERDLATIDVTAVRRQMGVVLQSSRLTAGDIYSNIVGSTTLPIETAWEAARMAGMEDDLREMPMGIHTVVAEGGGTLSGGQRQRLLIARALVHKPRILFFDEATSALDNRTQRTVTESIARLHATRVVIAHRLSTIRDADRIYVMERGRVVQAGTYDELIAVPGLFAELAARQEA